MDKKQAFIINILYYGIILFFAYLGLKYLLPIFFPFILAFLVVWVLNHPAGYAARKLKLKKKWLLMGILTVFYGVLFFLIVMTVSSTFPAIGNLAVQIPSIYSEQVLPALEAAYQHVSEFLQGINAEVLPEFAYFFQQMLAQIGIFLSNSSGFIVKAVSGFAASIPSAFVKIVVFIIASYFLASDYDHVVEVMFGLLPQHWKEKVVRVTDHTKHIVGVFFRSYSVLMLLTFVELLIGLWILRIPYASLIAFAIAVFDIMPVLGTGGVLIPWAVIAALIGNYTMAAGVLILYLVITIIRNTLEPRLVGQQIGLHPLATLISMFIGARLFGIVGLFGFPLTLSLIFKMKKIDE